MTHFKVPNSFEKFGNYKSASGTVRMTLSCKNSSRTAISQLETKAPLLVQRALYPDTEFSDMAHLYIMSSAGGVLHEIG